MVYSRDLLQLNNKEELQLNEDIKVTYSVFAVEAVVIKAAA